jgi:hypothetical protein
MIRILPLALVLGCGSSAKAPMVTAPAHASVASTTPCFPGPPLVATDIYKALEKYAWSLYASADDPAPPPTTYGSCKVDKNIVSSADGKVVAELGCGVRILWRGIRDDLGLELGARGQDVLDRKPKPVHPMTCTANGPDQVRCMFGRGEDEDLDSTMYVVAGTLTEDVLTGPAASTYFAARPIVEIEVSVWCH